MAEIKFCGLTRPDDARFAGALGARYLGVIFAGGPRLLDPKRAAEVLDGCESPASRVGVFGRSAPREIGRVARAVRLDIVQLHDDPNAGDIAAVRREADVKVWAVIRVTDALPREADALFEAADALLIDARVEGGALGGRGVPFDWAALRGDLERRRAGRRVVLAGGLRAENVRTALATLCPDVVDVSTGVESAPGIKDHARMRAFAAAVAGAAQERG